MHPRPAVPLALLACTLALSCPGQSLPQNPPPRPRLLFSQSDIPTLAARTSAGGVAGSAWSQMRSSASWWCGTSSGACGGGRQVHWRVERSLRYMTEIAARYAITGNATYGQRARQLLVAGGGSSAVGYLRPGGRPAGDFGAFREGAMASAVAITYDLIRPILSPSERSQVVSHLEGWVDSFRTQRNAVGSYASYGAATDNHSFAWNCGIAFALLSIWGDSSRSNIPGDIDTVLQKIHSGHNDTFSPDGSYDEGHGYINYGGAYAVRALLAARRCGFPDYLTGSNVLNTPRWYLALNSSGTFPLSSDTSDRHRGQKWDPIMYALVGETGDEEAFWGLERLAVVRPVSEDSDSMAFSPFLTAFLHYPDHLTPRPPRIRSAFFRDNRNLAPAGDPFWNKLNNNSDLGEGGIAYLHSDPSSGPTIGVNYRIRDEWMSHAHEDDGHVGLILNGVALLLDTGLSSSVSSPAFYAAQSVQHNIVTANGGSFLGGSTNHFVPPAPEGRFHGRREASLLGARADYVRGDHRFMWMTQEADRSVVLIKGGQHPLMIVHDRVNKGGGSYRYEQRWHTPNRMNGSGSVASPYSVSYGGQRINGVMLSPSNVQRVTSGAQRNPSTNLTYYRNELRATSSGPVDFLGTWSPSTPLSKTALPGPAGSTRGGILSFSGGIQDEILVDSRGTASDANTTSDARFVWIRRQGGSVTGYVVCEGSVLNDQGVDLVDASEEISVCARDGHIDITRPLDQRDTQFSGRIDLLAPFAVLDVRLDGEPIAHSVSGGRVLIGVAPPRTLPSGLPPFTLDRLYSFDPLRIEDGSFSGQGYITSAGELATRAGQPGFFRPLSGTDTYDADALWLGFDVETGSTSGGQLGAVHIEDPTGNRRLTFSVWDNPGVGLAIFSSGPSAQSPLFVSIPGLGNEPNVRVGLELDFASGAVSAHDRSGSRIATESFTPITTPVVPIFEVNNDARWDDIAILDDAEEASVPQGLVVWLDANGKLGFYVGTPNALGTQDLQMDIAGVRLEWPSVLSVLTTFGYQEGLVAPYLSTTPASSALREMCWSPALALPSASPGVRHVLDLITSSNDRLVEGAVR